MWRRSEWELKRAVRAALFVATMLFVLLVLPDAARACWTLAPARLRIWWAEALAFTLVIGYLLIACVATFGSDQWQWQARAKRALDRIHSWALYACGRGLPVSLSIACILLLLSWMPHYLTWPWSRDEDTFCVLAMSWDRGILPYRDIRAYNFPGETYLFWLLGKVFGWGRTAPFYFVDSSCVVIFGLALVYWSRQRLGGVVPGLIAYLAFLSFYLNQAFEITGERDWHTVFLVSVGLLVSQAWPGKRSRRGVGGSVRDRICDPTTSGAVLARGRLVNHGDASRRGRKLVREGTSGPRMDRVVCGVLNGALVAGVGCGNWRRFDSWPAGSHLRRAL